MGSAYLHYGADTWQGSSMDRDDQTEKIEEITKQMIKDIQEVIDYYDLANTDHMEDAIRSLEEQEEDVDE